MIPAIWLVGAGLVGALGVAAVVYNWDEVLDWLRDFLPKVATMIRNISKQYGPNFEHVAIMVADFLDTVSSKIEHKLYHKIDSDSWLEETTTRTLKTSELPPNVRRKLDAKKRGRIDEADITEEIEKELQMTL